MISKWELPVLTSEAVGDVDLEVEPAEQHGQRHGEVALCAERDVPVAGLEAVQRQDPLAQHLAVLVVHADTQHGQVRQHHLAASTGDCVVVKKTTGARNLPSKWHKVAAMIICLPVVYL